MRSRLSVAFLVVVLAVLAGLQYHWIGQITDAERQRLERTVRQAANDFSEDFSADLRNLFGSLELRPGTVLEPAIVTRYQAWAERAAFPKLLRGLYLARRDQFLQLDVENGAMEPVAWPAELRDLEEFLARDGEVPNPERSFFGQVPHIDSIDAFLIPIGRAPDVSRVGRDLRPEARDPRAFRGGMPPSRPPAEAWVVAELDRDVIVKEVFPAIVARRFAEFDGQNYRVAVVSTADAHPQAIFNSGAFWSTEDLSSPDYTMDLLGFAGSAGSRSRPGGPPGSFRAQGGPPRRQTGREFRGLGPQGFIVPALSLQNWQVLVKHDAGSIEKAATHFRRRNLAISFGILVILGIGAATIVISGQRAHRLGKLQMEFAAGMSHELRTPLAVIQSAAHNLGTGVVQDREGIEEYAAIVQKEARRLSDMVEQVMTYSETQSGRKRYDILPIDADDAVEQAIQHIGVIIQDGGATVVKRLDPDLPPVLADAGTLTRCIQNLMSNAIKYGGSDGPACIEIEGRHDPSTHTVLLSVTDHGMGVPEADVRHLFEAFHRGSNAATNVSGNGLGLYLVQKMMSAQNGSVAYESVPSGGAKFILTIPAERMVV